MLIYWFVGDTCEVHVSFVSTTPLINRVLDGSETDGKSGIGEWREVFRELNTGTELLNQTWFKTRWIMMFSYFRLVVVVVILTVGVYEKARCLWDSIFSDIDRGSPVVGLFTKPGPCSAMGRRVSE